MKRASSLGHEGHKEATIEDGFNCDQRGTISGDDQGYNI
jgi:hypothetical protein